MVLVQWVAAAAAWAGAGMWTPEQLPSVADALTADGIRVPAEVLADPKRAPLGAIASLGGCSASFVSPDGLVFTNAHCATRLLGQNSTPDHDRVVEGWLAGSRADELPGGPGARLWIVEGITDVTRELGAIAGDPQIPDAGRVAALDRRRSELVARCERAPGRKCVVVKLFGGQRWDLVQRLELRDLRVVWVPPANVAFFGGDADNFEWPRHDGDVAVLRAYVGPDGKPRDPAPTNVPYHPPQWLRIAPKGVAPGDPVMALGFPGRTERLQLPEALAFAHDVDFPARLGWFADVERILAEEMAKDPAAASKLQPTAHGMANGRKRIRGMEDDLDRSTVLADLVAEGQRLDAWLAPDPAAEPQRAAIAELRRLLAEENAAYATDELVDTLMRNPLLGAAHRAYRWSTQRKVPKDLDREPGFQDRDRDALIAATRRADAGLWLPFERRLTEYALRSYQALPEAQRVAALDGWLASNGGVDGAIDVLYPADPPFAKVDARIALLDAPQAKIEASTDPWVALAVALERGYLADRRVAARTRDGARLRDEPLYVAALTHFRSGAVAPDANGSLRVTFGRVTGFAPRDGLVAEPQTRLQGLVAKDRTPEYEAPRWLVDAANRVATAPTDADRLRLDAGLGDVPVNFLADLDTTGGSSGSATLDADGLLVGLAFDGNYESMASDWLYDPADTRSLHVDIRYILWLLDQDPAGSWLARELTPTVGVAGSAPR